METLVATDTAKANAFDSCAAEPSGPTSTFFVKHWCPTIAPAGEVGDGDRVADGEELSSPSAARPSCSRFSLGALRRCQRVARPVSGFLRANPRLLPGDPVQRRQAGDERSGALFRGERLVTD